jgi:hypothetical protein
MNANSQTITPPLADRVTSVDFFRGFTMFLLAGEAALLYEQFFEFDNGIFSCLL